MIEVVILNYLKTTLPVPVYMEKPEEEPIEYILIEKTGSGKRNLIKNATFAIQSYSDSLYKAALLNDQVKVSMDSITVLDDIGAVELNSDYNFTDTETKKYRYQAVFDIVHY